MEKERKIYRNVFFTLLMLISLCILLPQELFAVKTAVSNEGTTEGIMEGEGTIEGGGILEGSLEGITEGEGTPEGEGLFDPCNIGPCIEECDDVLGESHFEQDLAGFYKTWVGLNVDEMDLDENGMIDVVQAWLLDEVLRENTHEIHCCVKQVFRHNVESVRLYADEIQSAQPVIFLLINRQQFESVLTGLVTVGEKTTIDMLLGMIDELPIEVPMPDMEQFDLSMGMYLSKIGDADRDGVCNYGEYRWNLLNGYGIEGYKKSALNDKNVGNGGGCIWCGEGDPPEGEGIFEGIPEGIIEGTIEGEGIVEGEGILEGSLEGITEGEGTPEGEGLFDPCNIEPCISECDDVLGESHFEEDLRWLYEYVGERPDTADLDTNGVIDVVQAWLLDEVLRENTHEIHCCVKQVYRHNVESTRLYADEIQSVQPLVFLLLDRAKFEGVVSGLITVGEKTTIDMLLGMIDELPIEVPMPNMEQFDLSMARYLSKIGDADRDGVCNYGEYRWNLLNGYGIEGYKQSVLNTKNVGNGGGCVWCGEGEPPEGEGIFEGIPEGIIEGEGETPVYSSLTVILTPDEAVLNGAQWQIEGDENLYNSGDKVENLYAGIYKIFFTQPVGWSTSEYIQVEIGEKEDKIIEVNYWKSGGIVINIFPDEVVKLNAKWKIQGQEEWKESGKIAIFPIGFYEIVFSNIEGYVTPPQKRVYIPHASYISLDVSYQKVKPLDKDEKRNLALQIFSTYNSCDIDGDGVLIFSEIIQKYPQVTQEFFTEIDADMNQAISMGELENYIKELSTTTCGIIFGNCKKSFFP